MKFLISEVLTTMPDAALWQSGALILFTTILVGVAIWVVRPGSRQIYQKISQSPLVDLERIEQ